MLIPEETGFLYMAQIIHFRSEINATIKRKFRERLEPKSQRIRRLLSERRWVELRLELHLLKKSSVEFGFSEITKMSSQAEETIPREASSRAMTPRGTHEATTHLLNTIDTILGKNSWVH